MRKNYFTKNLLAVMMMLAVSMSMTSCQGFVDAVFGSEDNPVEKPETTEETKSSAEVKADGATFTIASGDDMEDVITEEQAKQMIEAIKASAENKEEYTITIKSEAPLNAKSFFGFVVPSIKDADINLVFDCDIESSENSPLVIDSELDSNTPTDAINELTITLPDGTDGVYLSLNTPETTVTLDGNVTYQFVEAITATNTLVVESGVTIKELQTPIIFNRNSVVVKNGGVIETFVYRTDVYFMGITEKGLTYAVTPGLEFFFPIAKDENGDSYFINCLKVVKGAEYEYCGLYHTFSRLHNDGELSPDLKKLIIGDGAVVRNMNYTSIPYDDIIGEGNATFLYGYNMNEISSLDQDMKYVDLADVNSVYNVTFKPKYDSGAAIYSIPSNNVNCTFITN